MSTSYEIGIHELDRRSTDGIDVALQWTGRTNEVAVVVVDTRNGETLRIEVDAADALVAFRHPYAYAPRKRLEHALAA
jgi:hypothetical protein